MPNVKGFLWALYILSTLSMLAISTDKESNASSKDNVHKRYEYQFSFKGPNLIQKSSEKIPFFEYGGHAIPSPEFLRLTTSMVGQTGYVWSKSPAKFEGFQSNLTVRIAGKGRLGADGMAFWYVKQPLSSGPVYGAADKWHGLAVIIDTYDNDNAGDNPVVQAVLNDGGESGGAAYPLAEDGKTRALAKCQRELRNRPFPVQLQISFWRGHLNVSMTNGLFDPRLLIGIGGVQHHNTQQKQQKASSSASSDSNSGGAKENELLPCFSLKLTDEQIKRFLDNGKEGFYFGISAATGGIADDHDVISLTTASLTQHAGDSASGGGGDVTGGDAKSSVSTAAQNTHKKDGVTEDEKAQLSQEFDTYYADMQRLEREREEKERLQEETQRTKDVASKSHSLKSLEQREQSEINQNLQVIFQEQNRITAIMRDLVERLVAVEAKVDKLVASGVAGGGGGKGESGPSGAGEHDLKTLIGQLKSDLLARIDSTKRTTNQNEQHHEGQSGGGETLHGLEEKLSALHHLVDTRLPHDGSQSQQQEHQLEKQAQHIAEQVQHKMEARFDRLAGALDQLVRRVDSQCGGANQQERLAELANKNARELIEAAASAAAKNALQQHAAAAAAEANQNQKQNESGSAGQSCVSAPLLIALALLQLAVLIAYQTWQRHRENSSKKFY